MGVRAKLVLLMVALSILPVVHFLIDPDFNGVILACAEIAIIALWGSTLFHRPLRRGLLPILSIPVLIARFDCSYGAHLLEGRYGRIRVPGALEPGALQWGIGLTAAFIVLTAVNIALFALWMQPTRQEHSQT